LSATILRRIAAPKKALAGVALAAATAGMVMAAAPASNAAATSSPKAIAQQKMSAAQFACFDKIVSHESGWNPHATNASSGAYGLVQALPANKMASAGGDWKSNPETQIKWGLNYMNERYGSPCAAWTHWQSAGSY
jgi:hypothetical protein